MVGQITDRRIVTYGFNPQAEVRATNIRIGPGGVVYDVLLGGRGEAPRLLKDLRLPMFGEHNVKNSIAAIAVAIEMDVDEAVIRQALAEFDGVKRRFTRPGEAGGTTVLDDSGQHPVEIARSEAHTS